MREIGSAAATFLNHAIYGSLYPLALWILLSGLDDVFLDVVCLCARVLRRSVFKVRDHEAEHKAAMEAAQKRCAIFLPCWKEDAVIMQMVENNLRRIEYSNYDFFIGVYPNDGPTLEAATVLDIRHPRVHVAVCPHDGPTSKADCLNWIYQRMMEFESANQCRFDVVLTHDAEDVIHPLALHWTNYYIDTHDMVQVPVLPLRTSWKEMTHGVYCDEFAEFQTKDMPGRQILGGFIPSNGVGTGFSRWALEKLAEDRGRIFQPECLTEDYENGLRLHLAGCSQMFMPIRMHQGEPVATREYFPRELGAAIRQRTRWVTGIALQTWERHGWRGGIGTVYWLWRDRKGLIGNPVSLLTSVIFVYGVVAMLLGFGMREKLAADPTLLWLMAATGSLQFVHMGVRAWCTSRVYGWRFAAWSPLRTLIGNYINCRATLGAVWRYASAKFGHKPLVWLKTDHQYPVGAKSTPLTLKEVVVAAGTASGAEMDAAIAAKPAHLSLEQWVLARGLLNEDQLYAAMSVMARAPLTSIEPWRVRKRVARSLPVQIVDRWSVLPFRVSGGHLFVASTAVLDSDVLQQLARFTKLTLRLHLVTPTNFERLRRELL